MTESVTLRIYIIFMCINLSLIFAGFSTDIEASATYSSGDMADGSEKEGFISMAKPLIDFIRGDGIAGLLVAGGLPYELRMLVGLPFYAMGVLLLLSLIKAVTPFMR